MRKRIEKLLEQAVAGKDTSLLKRLAQNESLSLSERIEVLQKAVELGEKELEPELELLKKIKDQKGEIAKEQLSSLSLAGFGAVLGYLIEQKAEEFFKKLAQFELEKEKSKLFKKALHQLRSQGIEIELEKEKPAPKRAGIEKIFLKKWIQATPSQGFLAEQVVFYFLSSARTSHLMIVHHQPKKGLMEIKLLQSPEKEAKRIVERFSQRIALKSLLSIAESYFLWIAGFVQAKTQDEKLKKDFEMALEKLGISIEPKDWESHPAHQLIAEKEENPPFDIDRLFNHHLCKEWVFAPELVSQCSSELENAFTSPIQLNQEQFRERIQDILNKYIEQAINGYQDELRYSLWELAVVLAEQGEQNLAQTAYLLGKNLTHLSTKDFVQKILLRHFPKIKEILPSQKGLIITP